MVAANNAPVARSAPTQLKRVFALVFLADWHPLLRDPLDLFRLSFGGAPSSSRCRATGTRSSAW
jgi:hypothetical protein